MARFLFVTWEGGGNQWPILAIARALGDHGHNVRIAGYDWASPWPPTDQRPLVVASLSTGRVFGDQTPRYQRIADALANVSARVLITTGGAVDETSLRLRENVRAVRFVSHSAVLRDASACVTHGGHGTMCAALCAGLAVLCLPNPAADQPYLARRIAILKAGLWLDRDSPTTEIRHALIDLLDGIEYRRAAERLAKRIRESPDTDGASSMLLALA